MRKNPPQPPSDPEQMLKLKRLSRREALLQLSAMAVGSSALAAACSSDAEMMNAATGGSGAGGAPATAAGSAAGTGAAGSTPSMPSTASAGMSGTAGRMSGVAGSSMSAAGSSAAGAPAMSAAGAPAAGAPAMSAAGAPAAGSGGMGAAGAGGMMTPLDSLACVVTPAMTDGPFFVDQQLERSNLVMGETEDSIVKAVPLHLVIGVFTANGMMCKPVSGVHVDIWHADALGIYSDVAPGAIQSVDTRGKKFLRGWQATDESGTVAFDTIWPGWYMSRTIHIHFKLRMLGSGSRMMSFTSQMFFDESINSMVLAKAPYSAHTGRSVLNDGDHIYNGTATNAQKPPAGQTPPGKLIMPTVTPMGAGYTAVLKIGLMG